MKKIITKQLQMYNGNLIPQIGYGTFDLKGEACINGVTHALNIGYRHIDTASFYGNSGQIAEVLKKCQLRREECFISSKIPPMEQGYDKTIKSCQRQLSQFGLQYLDCLLILWPGVGGLKTDDPKNASVRLETYRALEELHKMGLIKNIGVSNFTMRHLEHLLKNINIKPVLNQIEIHPLYYDVNAINFCKKNGILIEAYSSLAKHDPKLMNNSLLKQIALKFNKSVPQISLRWAYQKQYIVIPKSKTENYIQENLAIEDFEINVEDMNAIDQMNEGFKICWDPETIQF